MTDHCERPKPCDGTPVATTTETVTGKRLRACHACILSTAQSFHIRGYLDGFKIEWDAGETETDTEFLDRWADTLGPDACRDCAKYACDCTPKPGEWPPCYDRIMGWDCDHCMTVSLGDLP